MATTLIYELSFAGVPFINDVGKVVRLTPKAREDLAQQDQAPRKYQPKDTLVEEINHLLPLDYLTDFVPPLVPKRSLSTVARQPDDTLLSPKIGIGEWFYPTGAARWSVFRGLATSSMVKEMLKQTAGSSAKTFKMKMVPFLPQSTTEADYAVETSMYMLPPRPLAEHGGSFDGLFLVTLVDERWYWQQRMVSLRPTGEAAGRTSWNTLIDAAATALGISVTYSVSATYLYPEPDSQLYAVQERAAVLMDALGYNLGRTFVRNLTGGYSLLTNTASQTTADANRGTAAAVIRMAGGDLFSTLTQLPAGSLANARNSVLPATITVAFPIYVEPDAAGPAGGDVLDTSSGGASPVPYLLDSRYRNKRPSTWYSESCGGAYTRSTPITSASNYIGLAGTGTVVLHDTAKALFSSESDTTPRNATELNALALQLSQDYWDGLAMSALDEKYPGIVNWEPEGLHDVLWVWSADKGQASTRVMCKGWNQGVTHFQHSATNVPRGVGGPPVPLTVRDSWSGGVATSVSSLSSGVYTCVFISGAANLPTQNRWKGLVGGTSGERVLFDGTSGGTTVTVAWRGIDGTQMQDWTAPTTVTQVDPNVTYGLNLYTTEKMEFVYPAEWTSGGIQGVHKVPQTQTVVCLADVGEVILGTGGVSGTAGVSGYLTHWSGAVRTYDSLRQTYPSQELIWLVDLNLVMLCFLLFYFQT